jgi:hypothetical protein
MQYHVQEAIFDLPEAALDRSVNVLVFGDPALPFNIVITRDYFDEGGGMEQLLREQLKSLSTTGKSFKEIEFGRSPPNSSLPNATPQVAPERVAAYVSYIKQGHEIHQKIMLLALAGRQVLVVTATYGAPWTQEHQSKWVHMLSSFQQRPQ